MEEEPTDTQGGETRAEEGPSRPKPSLTVAEQIAQLRSQGVSFDVMGESEAAAYLGNENSYLRTRSYRKLYPRRPDGTYIGLDFAALRGLSSARERAGYQTNPLIAASLAAHGMRNTKSRRAKLSNLRVEEMAAALFCLSAFAKGSHAVARNEDAFRSVRRSCDSLAGLLPPDGSLASYLDFLWKLVDIWLPQRV